MEMEKGSERRSECDAGPMVASSGCVRHMTLGEIMKGSFGDDLDISCPACGKIHLTAEQVKEAEEGPACTPRRREGMRKITCFSLRSTDSAVERPCKAGEQLRVHCKNCGEATDYVIAGKCHNCLEVESRLEKYLKSEAGKEFVRKALKKSDRSR